MLKPDDFRRIALGLTGAIESAHMDHPDFRANGRIFATLHGDNRHGMVKLTPEQQHEFIARRPKAFEPERGAGGRQGCTRVTRVAPAWTRCKNSSTSASPSEKMPAVSPYSVALARSIASSSVVTSPMTVIGTNRSPSQH